MTYQELRAWLDEVAEEYRLDPDLSYEAGVGFATLSQAAISSPEVSHAATLMRDTFATWTHHIHAYGSGGTQQAALASHECIRRAVEDWLAGGRDDLDAFATRWKLDEQAVIIDRP